MILSFIRLSVTFLVQLVSLNFGSVDTDQDKKLLDACNGDEHQKHVSCGGDEIKSSNPVPVTVDPAQLYSHRSNTVNISVTGWLKYWLLSWLLCNYCMYNSV